MNTSTFLAALRASPALPLVFRSGDRLIPSGYHLTEVKRVGYETMDCGGVTHRWSETHFEIWVPPLAGALPARGHMPAAKFLAILDRVERELPLDGDTPARVHAVFADGPAALHDVTAVTADGGRLWVDVAPDRTLCKAAERRVAALTGGCCGTAETPASAIPEPAGTCCGKEPAAAGACCT